MKKFGQLAISFGLTALIGYLIYRGVPDWGQAWRVMIQGRPLFFLAGFGGVMLHMLLRAFRWGVLLSPVKRSISYRNLFSLTVVKYCINVIPPRVGEVVASVVLAKKEKVSAASVIAASLLERILDILTVVVIFGFYLAFFSHLYPPNSPRGQEIMLTIQKSSLVGFVVLCLGFVVLYWLLRSQRWIGLMPVRVQRIVVSFLEGFRALQQGGASLQVIVLSLAIWLSITLQLWILLHAYLETFPFLGAVLLMAITVVGVAIPTPGGVGGFQFFMDLALINFFVQFLSPGDPRSQAAGISNGCYIVSMVPMILIGLVFLNQEGLSLSRISEISQEEQEHSSQPSLHPK